MIENESPFRFLAGLSEVDKPPAAHLPTALIAEYLALAAHLNAGKSPRSDYQRANQLAFQLAMELPPDLWRAIPPAIAAGNAGALWDIVFKVRGDDALTGANAVWHAAGAGKGHTPSQS